MRAEDNQDEGVQPHPSYHGRENGSSEVFFSQDPQVDRFGNLAPRLAISEMGIQLAHQTAIETQQKKSCLALSHVCRIRLLE